MDKREVQYTQARSDLLHEMLKAGAFDLGGDERREFVNATVKQIRQNYPELDDHLIRKLIGDGIRATYGDGTTVEAERNQRGVEEGPRA